MNLRKKLKDLAVSIGTDIPCDETQGGRNTVIAENEQPDSSLIVNGPNLIKLPNPNT